MTTKKGAVPQNPTKFSFTDFKLNRLKPRETDKPTKQTEYSDTVCIGLKLIHSNLTGRKKFHFRYYFPKGKKKTVEIDEYPAETVDSARNRANRYKALLAEGVDPYPFISASWIMLINLGKPNAVNK